MQLLEQLQHRIRKRNKFLFPIAHWVIGVDFLNYFKLTFYISCYIVFSMVKKEAFMIMILLVLSIFLLACEKEETPKVKVTVDLEDNPISDGDTTNLILEVRNVGGLELNGRFDIIPEDPEFVEVSYAGDETFKIISGESIKKSYELTGITRTYEIGVKIKIDLVDLSNNSILYTNEDIVLYIRRE